MCVFLFVCNFVLFFVSREKVVDGLIGGVVWKDHCHTLESIAVRGPAEVVGGSSGSPN